MKTTPPQTPGLSANASTDEILDKQQTAARLQVSTRTLDVWMKAGRVPYLKVSKSVRFRWQDVLAHLTSNTPPVHRRSIQ